MQMNLGYAGLNSSGIEVMGLGVLDEESQKIIPDKHLAWEVPMKWSLDDAVTIPIAYSMVSPSFRCVSLSVITGFNKLIFLSGLLRCAELYFIKEKR